MLNTKRMQPAHNGGGRRGYRARRRQRHPPVPWQTDTCIGDWHYDRRVFEEHRYKTVGQVVRMLVDIVSKNGNLLLNVPVRGDGTIDEDEVAFLEGMAAWMDVNGEAIFGTRPWVVYGEGPSAEEKAEAGQFGGATRRAQQALHRRGLRFTTKGDALYVTLLGWPESGGAGGPAGKTVLVKSLATGSPLIAGLPSGASIEAREAKLGNPAKESGRVTGVELLGCSEKLRWTQDEAGLHVQLPAAAPCEHAAALKVTGVTLP